MEKAKRQIGICDDTEIKTFAKPIAMPAVFEAVAIP
jgi:hypothetical protein